ncbi:MAG: HAD family hydrolase [Candidatus Kapaibacteriales bacterium]
MSRRIKVVTIDFWNTIFDSSNGLERNQLRISTLKSKLSELGLNISDEEYQTAMQKAWEFFNGIWKNEQRTLSAYDSVLFFWRHFSAPLNENVINEVVTTFEECILYYPPILFDGVPDVLQELSSKFKLGIVSDTGFSPGRVLRELLERYSILQYFSAFSFSNETGVSKPHPKAFLKVLNSLNCEPEKAIHIGDIEETDIEGAKNLNMLAIRFLASQPDFFGENGEFHTKADFIAKSWNEVLEIINSLE